MTQKKPKIFLDRFVVGYIFARCHQNNEKFLGSRVDEHNQVVDSRMVRRFHSIEIGLRKLRVDVVKFGSYAGQRNNIC